MSPIGNAFNVNASPGFADVDVDVGKTYCNPYAPPSAPVFHPLGTMDAFSLSFCAVVESPVELLLDVPEDEGIVVGFRNSESFAVSVVAFDAPTADDDDPTAKFPTQTSPASSNRQCASRTSKSLESRTDIFDVSIRFNIGSRSQALCAASNSRDIFVSTLSNAFNNSDLTMPSGSPSTIFFTLSF